MSMFQVLLINYMEGIEYEELTLDSGNAILPDTTFSPIGGYIYVLTTSKVRSCVPKSWRPPRRRTKPTGSPKTQKMAGTVCYSQDLARNRD